MNRFAIRRSMRLPYTRFAIVPGLMCANFNIPKCCMRDWSINTDAVRIDRRRMARMIRREYESIAGDIEQLNDRWLS